MNTPKKNKSVSIFGAGVAGLSAAHEFAKLGYRVSVYETNSIAGGFFRSERKKINNQMPTEYSWHGMGPWYHNTFDIMKEIPFDESSSVYDKALSKPIHFGLVPDKISDKFNSSLPFNIAKSFRMSHWDTVMLVWILLKTWTANNRTTKQYSRLNAAKHWQHLMTDLGWKTWRSTFGPWIGSDWRNVSLHQVGLFFRKNLMSGPTHFHRASEDGPAWTHGSGSGWLLLRGPSNEWWFDKWIKHLKNLGVKFYWNNSLTEFTFDGQVITSAMVSSGKKIISDYYVLATTPFAAVEIFNRTPQLASLEQLKLFTPLTQDGPHTQVSFRIAFDKKIFWPKKRSAIILTDSEFNITLFAEEQVWDSIVNLGSGVKSLWTGTACVSSVPGRLFNLPLNNCTKEQFIAEVTAQIYRCKGLDHIIKTGNQGKSLNEFPILEIEVWHEWLFSPKGIKPRQPKWVTTTNTQPYLPTQSTPVPNLVLAGAHTKTQADVWSIESAVESGRRAVRVIEPIVKVLPQYKPMFLKILSRIDDIFFGIGLPHLLDVVGFGITVAFTVVIYLSI